MKVISFIEQPSAIRDGLDDVVWANEELHNLKAEKEELLSRQVAVAQRSEPIRVDKSMVKNSRRPSLRLSLRNPIGEREFTRLFMKQIDLNPDTGDILMNLYSRPPGLLTRNNTPASNETGVLSIW